MAAPVSSQQNTLENALSFQKALEKVTSAGSRKYVYNMYKLGYEAAEKIPPLHDRMLIGELCAKVTTSCQFYNNLELQKIQTNLAELKRRVAEKRSDNTVKRIFVVFLSCLYNWYKGFGFKDSLTLVEEAIRKTKATLEQPGSTDKDVLSVEGQIPFTVEEKAFLLELFSPKNMRSITELEGPLVTPHRDIQLLINGQTVNILRYTNWTTFECDKFPKLVFMYTNNESGYWSHQYPLIKDAQRVCAEQKLDRLIVPESSLLNFKYADNERSVLVKVKQPETNVCIGFTPKEEEEQLQSVVKQLTVFLIYTGFNDCVRNKAYLENVLQRIPDRGLYIDFKHFPFRTHLDNGLTRWKENVPPNETIGLMGMYPQYAQLIYDTAKNTCNEKKWKEIENDLNQGLEQAKKILQRKQALKDFYQSKNINSDTPALPLSVLNEMNLTAEQKTIANAVIADINEVIKLHNTQDLVLARQWRLTGDGHSPDSNFKTNIYHHRTFIDETLLPKLIALGYVHHIYNAKEARQYNLDVDVLVNDHDKIVQF